MRTRRALSLAAATLAGVGAIAVAPPTPASAATSCAIVCDGVDPGTAVYEDANGVIRRCNGVQTIYTVRDSSGWVELRYSKTCRMVWARGAWAVRVDGYNANGSLRVSYFRSDSNNPQYTLAVNDANLTARVCYFPASGVDWVCGGRY